MTVSVCMIVKNEERVLARCLDSLEGLYDELIIVDTGSTDKTKEIAGRYTDKVYDFEWVNDFSAARNFAFSHATMDYIYSADADEVLDADNRKLFKQLVDNILSEIEIVQMKYGNQLEFGTVYNFDEEYRPKLFKRLRNFVWIEPVHEQVRIDPIVFDSDIVITHMPESNHSGRDFSVFEKAILRDGDLSDRLWEMYARELYLAGTDEDFIKAQSSFERKAATEVSEEMHQILCLILTHAARINRDVHRFFKYAVKLVAGEGCSEICMEMGLHYEAEGDIEEAAIWYYNAAFETAPVLKATAGNVEPLRHLIEIYEHCGNDELAQAYRSELEKYN